MSPLPQGDCLPSSHHTLDIQQPCCLGRQSRGDLETRGVGEPHALHVCPSELRWDTCQSSVKANGQMGHGSLRGSHIPGALAQPPPSSGDAADAAWRTPPPGVAGVPKALCRVMSQASVRPEAHSMVPPMDRCGQQKGIQPRPRVGTGSTSREDLRDHPGIGGWEGAAPSGWMGHGPITVVKTASISPLDCPHSLSSKAPRSRAKCWHTPLPRTPSIEPHHPLPCFLHHHPCKPASCEVLTLPLLSPPSWRQRASQHPSTACHTHRGLWAGPWDPSLCDQSPGLASWAAASLLPDPQGQSVLFLSSPGSMGHRLPLGLDPARRCGTCEPHSSPPVTPSSGVRP